MNTIQCTSDNTIVLVSISWMIESSNMEHGEWGTTSSWVRDRGTGKGTGAPVDAVVLLEADRLEHLALERVDDAHETRPAALGGARLPEHALVELLREERARHLLRQLPLLRSLRLPQHLLQAYSNTLLYTVHLLYLLYSYVLYIFVQYLTYRFNYGYKPVQQYPIVQILNQVAPKSGQRVRRWTGVPQRDACDARSSRPVCTRGGRSRSCTRGVAPGATRSDAASAPTGCCSSWTHCRCVPTPRSLKTPSALIMYRYKHTHAASECTRQYVHYVHSIH